MLNPDENYDNPYEPDNVYGHTISLLDRHLSLETTTHPGLRVHLDLGCGFGRIAEAMRDRGLHYIGVDGSPIGPESLRSRGFEAHELIFDTEERTLAGIRAILKGRTVDSLTMLDTLEHLPNGDMVLGIIHTLIGESNAPAIISVPNIAHRDIGFRLALGRWDYTRDGLLDHTHTRLFNDATMNRVFRASGLHVIDSNHVKCARSDQHFPVTLPSLAGKSALHILLSGLREQVDDTGNINQFVNMVLAGKRELPVAYLPDDARNPKRPFLSLVTRTQGQRPHCLIELLTALAGQKDRDFELIVVGHKLNPEQVKLVERIIDDSPTWLRDATRLVREDEGNRTRPLNRGFQEAAGEYIAILDDDDIPMAHWISTFRKLALEHPGTVLRTIAARQEVETVEIRNRQGIRAIDGLKPYQASFDLFQHMYSNHTPPIALAFPRGIYHDLKIHFDETLTTTEDWDFFLRTAIVAGVSSSEEITSVYHWWKPTENSSRTVHDQEEWDSNYKAVTRKLDHLSIVLPPGSAGRLRDLHLKAELQDERRRPKCVPSSFASIPAESAKRDALVRETLSIISSSCWKITAPMRWLSKMGGRPRPVDPIQIVDLNVEELAGLIKQLRSSKSWRITRFIHRNEHPMN